MPHPNFYYFGSKCIQSPLTLKSLSAARLNQRCLVQPPQLGLNNFSWGVNSFQVELLTLFFSFRMAQIPKLLGTGRFDRLVPSFLNTQTLLFLLHLFHQDLHVIGVLVQDLHCLVCAHQCLTRLDANKTSKLSYKVLSCFCSFLCNSATYASLQPMERTYSSSIVHDHRIRWFNLPIRLLIPALFVVD